MFVHLSRVADCIVGLGAARGDLKSGPWDNDVGSVGTTGPFLTVGAVAESCYCGFSCAQSTESAKSTVVLQLKKARKYRTVVVPVYSYLISPHMQLPVAILTIKYVRKVEGCNQGLFKV